ncbi:hypothetical protein ACHAWX_007760 [Stephanocyclus meneghinianus]
MVRQNQQVDGHHHHQHVFSHRHLIQPLLLVILLSIGATLLSYKSIHYDNDEMIDEQVGRNRVKIKPSTHFMTESIGETSTTWKQMIGNKSPPKTKSYQLQMQPSKLEIPNYYQPKTALDKQKYWTLTSSNGLVSCQIQAAPIDDSSPTQNVKTNTWKEKRDKEQYVIHIHGLHHTGTGYLRQTLQDALNDEFAPNKDSPVASIHHGDFPYLQGLSSKRFFVPEDEGQHFQNVFPPYRHRVKLFKESRCPLYDFGRLFYLADDCIFSDKSNYTADSTEQYTSSDNSNIGKALLDEWSTFWNTSATFLIQKTPLLDVKFHESVKQLPTLHVIVVRHPMTSNAMKFSGMGLPWLDAFTHTLDILSKNEIEWYAVVTYEALIHYHDQVVRELIEVVRSGMKRFGSKTVPARTRDRKSRRRRLHLHAFNATNFTGQLSYLVPKDDSISLWEKCLKGQTCKSLLKELTSDVFPHFGYVSMDWADLGENIVEDEEAEEEADGYLDVLDETSRDHTDDHNDHTSANEEKDDEERSSPQLSPYPGLVTVHKQFGHVLFSSESDALRTLRKSGSDTGDPDDAVESNAIGSNPTPELVSTMRTILASYGKKYLATKPAQSKRLDSNERYWKVHAFEGGTKIYCKISTNSSSVSRAPTEKALHEVRERASRASSTPSSQYVIHIHGLVSLFHDCLGRRLS